MRILLGFQVQQRQVEGRHPGHLRGAQPWATGARRNHERGELRGPRWISQPGGSPGHFIEVFVLVFYEYLNPTRNKKDHVLHFYEYLNPIRNKKEHFS